MRFTKIKKAVAMLLLFALLFSTFPMSALANDTDNPEETAVTEDTATVKNNTGPTDDCLETGQATELEAESTETDELDSMWVYNPETGLMELRGPHYHIIRSYTTGSGYGGIYPRIGASSLAISYNRVDGSSGTMTLSEAGDAEGYGFVHYLRWTSQNDYPQSVMEDPIAYCVDPAKPTDNQQHYNRDTDAHYMLTNTISSDKIAAVKLVCAYGWPYGFSDAYSTSEETAFKRQYATQVIIWEIVMGLRGTSGRYERTDDRLYDHYAGNPWSTYYGQTNDAFISAYNEISDRLARHNTYPSFAASTAASAPVHKMTYNSSVGNYTITLTDTNGVLSPDFNSFAPPTGITVSKSGNTLTITATEAAMVNGDVTVSMTGRKVQAGTTYVWFAVNTNDESEIYTSKQPLTSIETASSVPAYFKLKAETKKPVTIKKETDTTGGSNVAACIQGNNMYSLAGAQFKITASGYSDKIVTTGADGTVVINDTYNVGTVITVQEIKAPPGYILNSQSKQFTVTADGNNVFVMKDKPVFDPERLVLTKTGNNNERIAGAVFKVEYFDNATHSGSPTCTWYFESKSNGLVQFTDDYLASGYTSSDLFKPDGVTVVFPLGSVKVTEIKAAPNYILPSGSAATAYIYIEQSQDTLSAKARWGDSNGNTVTTLGIYQFTNDGVNAVNDEYGHMTMKKTLPADTPGGLEGYGFNIFCGANGVTWHGRTDANGNIYQTNASHTAVAEGSRNYTFDGLMDGTYAFRELLSEREVQDTRTEQVTFTVYRKDSTDIVCQKTYSGDSLRWDTNGDCIIGDVELTGLSSGGTLAIEITNVPKPGYMVLSKTLPDDAPGSIEGYCFNIHRRAGEGFSAETWRGRTDQNGNIYKTNSSYAENTSPSDADYKFTGLYDGYYDFRELLSMREYKNTKTTKVTFTVTDLNGTQVMQRSYSGSSLSWQDNGDCTISKVHLTGLNGGGRLSITIQNEPIPVGSITVKKVDESGRPMPGVTFLLEYSVDSSTWFPVTSREETSSITPGGCTSAGLSDGKLITGSDGLAAFTGLCLETDSGPVFYRLTETATKPGYGLLAGPAYEGPLPEGETHDVTLTAVNMPEFQMPMTGGRGFTGTAVSTLVALTAAAALVCLLRKKRKI